MWLLDREQDQIYRLDYFVSFRLERDYYSKYVIIGITKDPTVEITLAKYSDEKIAREKFRKLSNIICEEWAE